MVKDNPGEDFEISEQPEQILEETKGDLLQSYYAFNWEQVQETLAKLRRFRYIQPTDARELLVKKLLPVVDSFERLFELADDSEAKQDEVLANWLKNFESVYKRLLKILAQEGVEAIESVGQSIDLDHHEVVGVENTGEASSGTVLREEQKGYRMHGKVLRDAKVVVSKTGPENRGDNQPERPEEKEG